MTLAVAVRIPIGFLERLPPLPDGTPFCTPGVILMTDSRYSELSGGVYSDTGAKLWHLGNRIAGAFAGSVELAEKGMSATKRRLDAPQTLSFRPIAEAARDGFRAAIPNARRTDPLDRVDALVATVAPAGEVGIIGVSSTADFEPRYLRTAGQAILRSSVRFSNNFRSRFRRIRTRCLWGSRCLATFSRSRCAWVP